MMTLDEALQKCRMLFEQRVAQSLVELEEIMIDAGASDFEISAIITYERLLLPERWAKVRAELVRDFEAARDPCWPMGMTTTLQ
jgi:hypothetical protein